MDGEIPKIFEKAYAREHITQDECVWLLALKDTSPEEMAENIFFSKELETIQYGAHGDGTRFEL